MFAKSMIKLEEEANIFVQYNEEFVKSSAH